MSMLKTMLMTKKKKELPENIIMQYAGDTILLKDNTDTLYTWTKDNDGLAYAGYFIISAGGSYRLSPMLVSETKDNCAITRTGGSAPRPSAATISSTPFSYKGKDWYYISMANATTIAPFDNGRYLIEGVYDAYDYIIPAKALLDYVYSFL